MIAVSALTCGAVVAVFAAARVASKRLGHPPWASPVLMAALVVAAVLALAGVPVARFAVLAAPLRWLLGPALVALATIVAGNAALLRSDAVPVLVAVVGGALVGIGSATLLGVWLGLDGAVLQAVTVKTVTAPFVVAIMQSMGGPVGLAAALSVLTGVIGALTVPLLLGRIGVKGAALGLGVGVSSHIVGTDWLTRRDAGAGGLAALAFVLVGLTATLVVPLVWGWLF